MIRLRRVYDPPEGHDGARFLVERLWPRGMKKNALHMDGWHRDVAPSDDLRRWFAHDPKKWKEFRRRYFAELEARPERWQPLLQAANRGDITLLYSAREPAYNNAAALKVFLEEKQRGRTESAERS
jgi:uncharacterized protein YeaO (DUF488 family)